MAKTAINRDKNTELIIIIVSRILVNSIESHTLSMKLIFQSFFKLIFSIIKIPKHAHTYAYAADVAWKNFNIFNVNIYIDFYHIIVEYLLSNV